jgi:hypothetical protein
VQTEDEAQESVLQVEQYATRGSRLRGRL